ncbi:ABC transporter permease, partial [Candidatus Pacearchaeota archaeon]|nr:ABC transporter permease [Candidatus Pacearchaeota archaeon]
MKLLKNNGSLFLPVISVVLVVGVWELVFRFGGWSSQVLPGPLTVFNGFVELIIDGSIFQHSVASLYRVTVGFFLAALLGIPLGIFIGMNRTANTMLNPWVQFLRPISPLAWIPLAMLWFGIGDAPAIFLIFLSSFFSLVVATSIAVHSI